MSKTTPHTREPKTREGQATPASKRSWSVHDIEGIYHIYDGFGYVGEFYSKQDADETCAAVNALVPLLETAGKVEDVLERRALEGTILISENEALEALRAAIRLATASDSASGHNTDSTNE